MRPYLELNNVREGAFYVANRLYGITFTEIKDIPKPHEEAQAFECKDKDGTHLGVLYMDFFLVIVSGEAHGAEPIVLKPIVTVNVWRR